MTTRDPADNPPGRKVLPDELSEGFQRLDLFRGECLIMHASLESFGTVEGGAAMILHRLLELIGKEGALLMPTFTSASRHSQSHENYTKPGCWCEGKEDRHVPFIPELQPDKEIGYIAHRLCSWPNSRRSRHPAYSFVAVGRIRDELVRDYSLQDPLLPVKRFLNHNPQVLMAGVAFDSVSEIHLAEQKRLPQKFPRERALMFSSSGKVWQDIISLGCSNGFEKLKPHLSKNEMKETKIGLAQVQTYPMMNLLEIAESLLDEDAGVLACNRNNCLSCRQAS